MLNNIEELFKKIKYYLNDDEKNNCGLYIYTPKGFTKYKSCLKKENLSLVIKIKENRKDTIIQALKLLSSKSIITNDNNYYVVIEINKGKNYIVLDYVVNSHIIIPNSFLEHFGYKTKEGIKIDYIDMNEKSIRSEKTKKYKTQYGYYSKLTEEILNQEFENKIAIITKELQEFRKKDKINLLLDKEKIEIIHNFFDITTYRNIDILNQVNRKSVARIIVGEYTHDQLMNFIFSHKLPHVYKDLKVNIIINKTSRDFIINDSMISSIICDGGNEVIIMPINKKECLALMKEEYRKKYVKEGNLYFMNIENDNNIEMINSYIYRYAKEKKENIIGSRSELEILLRKHISY